MGMYNMNAAAVKKSPLKQIPEDVQIYMQAFMQFVLLVAKKKASTDATYRIKLCRIKYVETS